MQKLNMFAGRYGLNFISQVFMIMQFFPSKLP